MERIALVQKHQRKEIQMTKTARIVRFHQTGGAEVLRIEDLPIPDPG